MMNELNAYNCPNCGAPVAWKEGQSLAICMHCNTTLPASRENRNPQSPSTRSAGPLLQADVAPSLAVIDEFKRLLVIGSTFASSVKATWLVHRGRPAQATAVGFTALNRWKVRDTNLQVSRLRGQNTPIQLLRLLLEVRPLDGNSPAHITEGNCMVGEKSQPKFQVGNTLMVKVHPRDPKKVVVV
jgi:hypothetical protein